MAFAFAVLRLLRSQPIAFRDDQILVSLEGVTRNRRPPAFVLSFRFREHTSAAQATGMGAILSWA